MIQIIRISSQEIGMEFGIEKMCHAQNEKWKKTKKLMESKYQIKKESEGLEKRKLIVLWNIGSGHHETSGDERKKKEKRVSQTNEKPSRNQAL